METPTFVSSAHNHTTYSGLPIGIAPWDGAVNAVGGAAHRIQSTDWGHNPSVNQAIEAAKAQIKMAATPSRRIVQVYIADTNENVPLEKSVLYTGDQKLTDSTDQELFFEIDIKGILDAYNAERIKFVDKSIKDRTQYLEPAKIRELKMVVVTVATF